VSDPAVIAALFHTVFVALLQPVNCRTLVHIIVLASAITSTRHISALLNCRMASPIFTVIAAAASIRPDRINWFFRLSILFTDGVMYGGSANVIVTVRSAGSRDRASSSTRRRDDHNYLSCGSPVTSLSTMYRRRHSGEETCLRAAPMSASCRPTYKHISSYRLLP